MMYLIETESNTAVCSDIKIAWAFVRMMQEKGLHVCVYHLRSELNENM